VNRLTPACLAAFGALLVLLSAVTPAHALDRLSGEISMFERTTLPADSTLVVDLLDIAPADERVERLARLALPTRGRQAPLAFELPFHPDDIRPAHRYAVRATLIDGGGRLLFATPDWVPVLTQDRVRTISLVLHPARDIQPPTALENTYWKLLDVAGQAARVQAGEREAHLLLLDGRATGGSGCNKLMGRYATQGRGKLTLGPLASTRMACTPEVMAQEAALHDAYARTRHYRIDGDRLELREGDTVLARFQARRFD